MHSHSYLGVEISQDLKWDAHISKITASANRVNGFIRRNLESCPKETKSLAYKTLVRPIIEYSSSVWDPYTKEHIQEIGKVQRRAARMVCNDYSQSTSDSVSKLMEELGWDLLSTRRKTMRVCLMHKALGGHLALPVSDYLRPAARATRHSTGNSFTQYSTRTNCFKYSFIPRTIKDWNSLPPGIQTTPHIDNFKLAATNFFVNQDLSIKD